MQSAVVSKPSSASQELTYRLATTADADACNQLHTHFYRHGRTTAQWLWEFPPTAAGTIPYAIACDGDRIIGTQGLLLVPMIDADGPFLSAKGEDALVLPEYWSRDVLSHLWRLLVEYCLANEIRVLWGFNSRKGSFKRVGFRYFDEADCSFMIRPLRRGAVSAVVANTSRVKKAFERPGGSIVKSGIDVSVLLVAEARNGISFLTRRRHPTAITVSDVNEVTGECDDLCRRFVSKYSGTTVFRSSAFLNYRLLKNPFVASTISTARIAGSLCGYAAWCIFEKEAFLTDCLIAALDGPTETRIAESLLQHVIDQSRRSGAVVIRFTSFNSHPADRILRNAAARCGFFRYRSQVGACARPASATAPRPGWLDDYNHWFLTGINFEGRTG